MKKLPRWAAYACYGVAFVLINWDLWRLRADGLTAVSFALLLVGSFCLAKLSYLVWPHPSKRHITVIEVVKPAEKLTSKRLA